MDAKIGFSVENQDREVTVTLPVVIRESELRKLRESHNLATGLRNILRDAVDEVTWVDVYEDFDKLFPRP